MADSSQTENTSPDLSGVEVKDTVADEKVMVDETKKDSVMIEPFESTHSIIYHCGRMNIALQNISRNTAFLGAEEVNNAKIGHGFFINMLNEFKLEATHLQETTSAITNHEWWFEVCPVSISKKYGPLGYLICLLNREEESEKMSASERFAKIVSLHKKCAMANESVSDIKLFGQDDEPLPSPKQSASAEEGMKSEKTSFIGFELLEVPKNLRSRELILRDDITSCRVDKHDIAIAILNEKVSPFIIYSGELESAL